MSVVSPGSHGLDYMLVRCDFHALLSHNYFRCPFRAAERTLKYALTDCAFQKPKLNNQFLLNSKLKLNFNISLVRVFIGVSVLV